MFSVYPYHSSVSVPFREHCAELAHLIYSKYPTRGLVVDIASNDGLLVGKLRKKGLQAVGVEPARNLVDTALRRGFPTFQGYWNREMSGRVMGAQVITAQNVLAHVDNLSEFLHCVWAALSSDGVFIFEVPYAKDLIEKLEFDTVYHEHLSYFLMEPLIRALQDRGFGILEVEHLPIHGGSLRVTCEKGIKHCKKALQIAREEREAGLIHEFTPYENLQARLAELCTRMRRQFHGTWRDQKVVGFGAAAKGTVFLNYCGIGPDQLHYVVDDTPMKQGTYMPGTRIPIVSRDHLLKDDPDVILILAWNFAGAIIQSLPEQLRERCQIAYRCGGALLQTISGGDRTTPEDSQAVHPRAVCELEGV
jgi:hypothetical protein